jgi:transcription initiation factor TFIID subunit 11
LALVVLIGVFFFASFAARAVQARRGDTGPLSPDHLREAYRMYQEETGRVGAARPLKAKKLFVK